MKQCSMCGEWKDESLFHPSKTRADGLQSRCKPCKASMGKYVPRDNSGLVKKNTVGAPKGTYTTEKFVGRVGGDDHMQVKSLRFGQRIDQYEGDKLRSME